MDKRDGVIGVCRTDSLQGSQMKGCSTFARTPGSCIEAQQLQVYFQFELQVKDSRAYNCRLCSTKIVHCASLDTFYATSDPPFPIFQGFTSEDQENVNKSKRIPFMQRQNGETCTNRSIPKLARGFAEELAVVQPHAGLDRGRVFRLSGS